MIKGAGAEVFSEQESGARMSVDGSRRESGTGEGRASKRTGFTKRWAEMALVSRALEIE